MSQKRWFKWTIEIQVERSWVADGFDMSEERAHDMLVAALPYAYNTELKAKVLTRPPADEIAKAQGSEIPQPAGRRDGGGLK